MYLVNAAAAHRCGEVDVEAQQVFRQRSRRDKRAPRPSVSSSAWAGGRFPRRATYCSPFGAGISIGVDDRPVTESTLERETRLEGERAIRHGVCRREVAARRPVLSTTDGEDLRQLPGIESACSRPSKPLTSKLPSVSPFSSMVKSLASADQRVAQVQCNGHHSRRLATGRQRSHKHLAHGSGSHFSMVAGELIAPACEAARGLPTLTAARWFPGPASRCPYPRGSGRAPCRAWRVAGRP